MSGNFVNGRLMQMHLHRSFSARIRRSATGACSSQERSLRVASISARASQRGSNRPSTLTISGGNPRSMQTLRTFLMLVSVASACDKKTHLALAVTDVKSVWCVDSDVAVSVSSRRGRWPSHWHGDNNHGLVQRLSKGDSSVLAFLANAVSCFLRCLHKPI